LLQGMQQLQAMPPDGVPKVIPQPPSTKSAPARNNLKPPADPPGF